MDEELDYETEAGYASDLAEARFSDFDSNDSEGENVAAAGTEERINMAGAFLFAAFIFCFFDLPQYLFDFLGWGFLSVINSIIAMFGWLTIHLWLSRHGRSLFDAKGGWKLFLGFAAADMIPLVPGLSGFVITYILKERFAKAAGSIPGLQTAAEKLT